jgi:nitrous oxidase accessory protein NosD
MSSDWPAADATPTTEAPLLAGRYQLLEKLGQGGMGTVFRARDANLERPVAIKMLPEGSAPDADAVARFKREAKALARLAHPGIIQAHDSGDERGQPFLVMELVEGHSLAALLRDQGHVAPARAADFAYQAALALHHAHQHGLVHRDVKPSNLLLSADGRVRLLDLGLARFLQDQIGEAHLTRTRMGMGTPDYCSPEQFHDAHKADARSDIYSLGCTVYHLIAGRVPFPGSSVSEKLEAHETKEPVPLEELCSELPAGLALAVRRMMAKRSADRFQTMADVAEALMPHVASSSVSFPDIHKSATWVGSRLATVTAPPQRRRVIALAAAGVTAILVLVAVGVVGLTAGWFRTGSEQVAQTREPVSTPSDTAQTVPPGEPRREERANTADDANVLTVSQKKEDGGKYRTIRAALDEVTPGQTIRVLDDGVYAERVVLSGAGKHARLTLEAPRRATLQITEPGNLIEIRHVPGVILRGFRLQATTPQARALVYLEGRCAGTELDGLVFLALPAAQTNGLEVVDANFSGADDTSFALDVHDCAFRKVSGGCIVTGIHSDYETPMPVEAVCIRNNDFQDMRVAVLILGEVRKVQVVGNRAQRMSQSGVQLERLLRTTDKILIANNTFIDSAESIRVWDGQITLTGVAIRNNLVLSPAGPDMVYLDSGGNPRQPRGPGDGPRLSSTWKFSHNWREARPPTGKSIRDKGWIPPRPGDTLSERIDRVNRDPKSPDFLRPEKDSPLATAGAGNEDPSLPRYVGALPPAGSEPWDWERAWRVPKDAQLLTVSKDSGGGGKYRTINDALKDAKPWATIRVLDDQTYEEAAALTDRKKREGLALEAVKGATLLLPMELKRLLAIENVPHVRIAGFKFIDRGNSPDVTRAFIVVSGAAPGVTLTHLELTAKSPMLGIVVQNATAPAELPLQIESCMIRPQLGPRCPISNDGINIVGNIDREPTAGLCVRSNRITGCVRGINLHGALREVHVTGNLVANCRDCGLQVEDLMSMSRGLLLANNTAFASSCAFRVWDDAPYKDPAAGQVEVANNLFFQASQGDMGYFLNPGGGKEQLVGDFQVLRNVWRFHHNCRDFSGPRANVPAGIDDTALKPEDMLSVADHDLDLVRPGKGSRLGTVGAGARYGLPAYIGALPPDGVPTWDWDRTWRSRVKLTGDK